MKAYIKPEMEIYVTETIETFMLDGSDGQGNSLIPNGGNTGTPGAPNKGDAKFREMEEAINDIW